MIAVRNEANRLIDCRRKAIPFDIPPTLLSVVWIDSCLDG